MIHHEAEKSEGPMVILSFTEDALLGMGPSVADRSMCQSFLQVVCKGIWSTY